MAGKERNAVDYFPHFVKHGKKMSYIRKRFGNDGYAAWFMLLEELGKSEFHYLDLSDEIEVMYLSEQLLIDEEKLNNIIEVLVKFEEFDSELWHKLRVLYNPRFINEISDAYRKRNSKPLQRDGIIKLLLSKGRNVPPEMELKAEHSAVNEINGGSYPYIRIDKNREDKSILENIKKEGVFVPSEDNFLESEILKFFGFNEIANYRQMVEVSEFCNCLKINDRTEYFHQQFKAYIEYKSISKSIVHGFKKFLGNQKNKFEDGVWNEENWVKKLNEFQQNSNSNGNSKQSIFNQRAVDRAELTKFAKQVLSEKLSQNPDS